MIEVSLYAVPAGSDVNVTMGQCVDRSRFDKETMGVSVMDFVKGFLRTNVASIEVALGNPDIINVINGDAGITTKDFACINYWLVKAGYLVKIQNVTDDEDNATDVPAGTAEWNVIDSNFVQYDYPTAIKIIPTDGMDIVTVLRQAIDQSGLFDDSKFSSTKNPLKEMIENLEKVKELTGRIEPGYATRIYDILDQVGVKLFLATSTEG